MENTNNKRYWLRGGGIGIGFIILLYITIWIFSMRFFDALFFIPRAGSLFCYYAWIYDPYHPVYGIDQRYVILLTSITIIMYFVLGAIGGWLYGKIKKRNSALSNV